jgi:hypothetical protein
MTFMPDASIQHAMIGRIKQIVSVPALPAMRYAGSPSPRGGRRVAGGDAAAEGDGLLIFSRSWHAGPFQCAHFH